MSLTYYFGFGAPAGVQAAELQEFLKAVEKAAQVMGFDPTLVLNAEFDTAERRSFARRLTTGFPLEDDRLRGVSLPKEEAVWEHDPHGGSCHLLPKRGVLLVLTGENGCESTFGFFQYPEKVNDIHGRCLAETGLGGRWYFRDFVDSPDPRFRKIVQMFRNSGYLEKETDEFCVNVG